jgi:hypothetical protein
LVLASKLRGQTVNKVLQFSEVIQSSAGAAYPSWASSGNLAIAVFNRAFLSSDFAEMKDAYQRVQFTGIKVIISRLYTEPSVSAIFADGIPQLKMAYFPGLTSGSLGTGMVNGVENALKVNSYPTNNVEKVWPVPHLQALNSTGAIAVDMASPMDTATITGFTLPGTIGISWDPNGNAASTKTLYQVTFQVMTKFDIPY